MEEIRTLNNKDTKARIFSFNLETPFRKGNQTKIFNLSKHKQRLLNNKKKKIVINWRWIKSAFEAQVPYNKYITNITHKIRVPYWLQ